MRIIWPRRSPTSWSHPNGALEPGDEFRALWGTGYETGRAFIEIEHRHEMLQSFWTPADRTQIVVEQAVSEAMRGGFTLHVTMVRENRAYLTSHQVNVPWSNKNLTVKWEHFVSKLEPAQKETWTAVITGPDAENAVAEMVATLYDQSLDAYLPHGWPSGLNVFRMDHSNLSSRFENSAKSLRHMLGNWSGGFQKRADSLPVISRRHRERISGAISSFGWQLPRVRGTACRTGSAHGRDGCRGRAKARLLEMPKSVAFRRRGSGRACPRPERGFSSQKPERDRFLLPASACRRRGPSEDGVHDARSAHAVEVHGLCP